MEKYKIIVFLILFLIVSQALSQSNMEKYWYYRDRMFSGFMIMGDGLGYSNVAGIRNYNKSISNIPESFYLHYGQQGIYMGWYIGVLAMEYKLQFDAGKSTEKTLTELYNAIEA